VSAGRKKQDPLDVYDTPEDAVLPILNEIAMWRHGSNLKRLHMKETAILEPCAGSGAILSLLRDRNHAAIGWDIAPQAEGVCAVDFLAIDLPPCFDLIITNPPFSKAQEIIDKARSLLLPDGMAVMLLRLAYLESQTRAEWWKAWMPERIYVLSKRPSFTGKGTDSAAYAWFVWRNGPRFESSDLRLL